MPRLAPVTIPVMEEGFRMSDFGFRWSPAHFGSACRSPEIRHPTSDIPFSYLDRVLQRETEPGLGGNADPLSFGKHLYSAPGARAGDCADGGALAAAENSTEDRAYRGRAA